MGAADFLNVSFSQSQSIRSGLSRAVSVFWRAKSILVKVGRGKWGGWGGASSIS